MYCYKCGQPTIGDNIVCDDCRGLNKCEDCGYENCICDEEYEDDDECEECGMKYNNHMIGCPNNLSGFNELYINGYD